MSDDASKIVPLAPASESLGRSLARTGSSRRRMDVLLAKKNARGLIRALPTEDLYYLIKDVGLGDAGLLVSMATAEQFQGFMDLEAWEPAPEGAELQTERVLEWLEVVRDTDPEAYRPKLQSLDLEVIELILRGGLLIVDRREEEEAPTPPPRPGPESLTWELTDCGNFYIAYTEPDSTEGKALRRMLGEIYAIDAFGAARLLSAVRVELDSELSESALQVRSARMEDLGFPPYERALEIYARRSTDPKSELPPQPASPETIPGFQLAQVPDGSFLQRAAASVRGLEERTHLDRGLLYLTNMAVVADRVPTHDDAGVRAVTERVHATLSLALEHLSSGDDTLAGALIQQRALKALFQVGFTLTLELQQSLERMLREAGIEPAAAARLFDEPEASALTCLLARRPTLAKAVVEAKRRGWPGDPEAFLEEAEVPLSDLPEGQQPFASRADLALGEQVLEGVRAVARLLAPGGALASEEEEAPPFGPRVATWLVARAADAGGPLAPLKPELASRGLAALFEPGGALKLEPWREAARQLTAEAEGSRFLVARAFARLVSEARPVYLAGNAPDPRYLTALWLSD